MGDRPGTAALAVALGLGALVIGATAGCSTNGGATTRDATVTVFAAASLAEVFTAIGDEFEAAAPGAAVDFSFGPSSELVTQIAEGAPADVLATADETTMADAVGARAIDGEPTAVASNRMEIAVPEGNPGGITGLADLADRDLVIGLCAEEVPCGRLARQALRSAGVEPSVDTDEADVKALLAKIAAGEVDAGLVYRTDVRAADDVDGIDLPPAHQVTTRYLLATVAGSAHPDRASDFVAFVASPDGRTILERFGFGPP